MSSVDTSSVQPCSDLGNIIRADHDYIELLVNAIKEEPLDIDEVLEGTNTNVLSSTFTSSIKKENVSNSNDVEDSIRKANLKHPKEIKTEPEEQEIIFGDIETKSSSQAEENIKLPLKDSSCKEVRYEQNSSLSTLAEVSLATAGKFYEPHLNREIHRARANLYPSQKDFNASIHQKSLENSFDDNEKVSQNTPPTIDIPKSVKDAILASANISTNGNHLQNLYHSQDQNHR